MAIKFITYAARVSAPRELAELTDILVLKQEGSRYRPRRGDLIINWGCSEIPEVLRGHDLRYWNHPNAVKNATNKTKTFQLLHAANVPAVQHTTNIADAISWCNRGKTVIQRNVVSGRQGDGIVICSRETPPTRDGRLWTKYFDRKDEYRVHVFKGEVIDVQKKRLTTEVRDRLRRASTEAEQAEKSYVYRIRSYPNGWVFCRKGVVCPTSVSTASVAAVRALGLDFGAVDIGFRRSDSVARVFEVNTAPGIEGTSIRTYADAILGGIQKS